MENFGEYLRRLRLEQRLSLRDVEEKADVSNSYIALIEKGLRKPPGADVLKRLAAVYNVPVRDLLKAAGYLDEERPGISDAEEVEMAFQFVMNDPRYRSGTRLKGELSLEVKRFIVEMYEKSTGKKLLS
jgi:transcriptional regulator with XRE-family HTH domain